MIGEIAEVHHIVRVVDAWPIAFCRSSRLGNDVDSNEPGDAVLLQLFADDSVSGTEVEYAQFVELLVGLRNRLNLVESQKTEMDRLRTENQQFRDENNRLKGEQGQPKIKPNKDQENKDQEENSSTSNYSSEKERGQSKQSSSKGRNKGSKNDKIKIDREQVLPVEPEILPDDAEFKGYEDVIVQDIKIETDNVRFRKEKYYSPSEGKTYLAQLPSDYKGQFGPSIKAWVIVMYFAMNVSEPKIVTFFETVGI
jgi:hypothetical protein